MRIHELTEASQYSTYKNQLLDFFYSDLFKRVKETIRINHRMGCKTLDKQRDVEWPVRRAISELGKVTGEITKFRVDVRISDHLLSGKRSRASGWAYPDILVLSKETYFDPIVNQLRNFLEQVYYDNMDHEDQNQFEVINDALNRDSVNEFRNAAFWNNDNVGKMIKTFLHELAHLNQMHKSKKWTYRSYLQKSPTEFSQAYQQDSEGNRHDYKKFARMHSSSPEEIDANVQNLTLDIVEAYGWDDAYDPNDPALRITDPEDKELYRSTIFSTVSNHLEGSGILPNTPKTRMIYKRYLTRVYQECERYRKSIIDKLKTNNDFT
jgi:hypothetical protein